MWVTKRLFYNQNSTPCGLFKSGNQLKYISQTWKAINTVLVIVKNTLQKKPQKLYSYHKKGTPFFVLYIPFGPAAAGTAEGETAGPSPGGAAADSGSLSEESAWSVVVTNSALYSSHFNLQVWYRWEYRLVLLTFSLSVYFAWNF